MFGPDPLRDRYLCLNFLPGSLSFDPIDGFRRPICKGAREIRGIKKVHKIALVPLQSMALLSYTF
jgi:hypothetical protein